MPFTTTQVAGMLGVSTDAVRQLAHRGVLTPLLPGARPLLFDEFEVWRVQRDRTPTARRQAITQAWDTALGAPSLT